jgi:hypothetical protein
VSRFVFVAALMALAGCATVTQLPAFSYQLPDNRETDVAQVMATLPGARESRPENPSGEPLVVASLHEETALVALSLDGTERWRTEVTAMTRPEVLGDLVVTSDREGLVALDAADGRVLWRAPIEGLAYVGSTRSGSTLVYVASVGAGGGATRVGRVRAVDARSGRDLWEHEISGTLGHPQARGSWVFVPWDRQNVAILELGTGIEKARLRSTDDVVAWVRDLPSGLFYGGPGIYRFDARSASGTKAGSTYLPPLLPEAPREPLVADDGFFPTPGTRSARGRIRLYATPEPSGEALGLLGDRFYFVYYRYVFGYDAERNLQWARMLDEDVIAAEALASGLFVVGERGGLRVLDPATGSDVWTGGSERALASAGLDVRGFAPTGSPAPRELATSLAEIAGDPDNRLVPARAFAVEQLGRIEDPAVSSVLLDLYAQRSVPSALRETITEVLRRRTIGTEHLVAALQQRYDYLDERPVPPLELLVPALLEQRKTDAVAGLVAHMLDHETPIGVLPLVVRAVVELGDASVVPALRSFLVLYHADSTFSGQADALAVAAEGIYRHGGDEGRAMLTALAGDGRSLEGVSTSIRDLFDREARDAEARARAAAEAEAAAAEAAARAERAGRPARLTQAQINAVFAERADALRACFQQELEHDPQFSQLRVVFILENTGVATDVQYSPPSETLTSCLRPVVDALRFPQFQQRRQRGSFTVTLRGETVATPTTPNDRFWWSRAERQAGQGDIGRPWWEVRQAPRVAPTQPTQPNPPTQPTQPNQPWWLEGGEAGGQTPPPGGSPTPPAGGTPPSETPPPPPEGGGSPWWLPSE